MKWMKLQIPDRLHQRFKEWAVMSGQKQNDIIYYLFDNLPPTLKVRPNNRLLSWLEDPTNKEKLTPDQFRIYELIGLGLVEPLPEEVKQIKLWTRE